MGPFASTSVLITGANGFIGSHAARRLVRLGANLHAIVRHGSNLWRVEDIRRKLNVCEADITDGSAIREILSRASPEVVFHLAGPAGAARLSGGLDTAAQNIICGSINLFEALLDLKPKAIAILGSSEEYGNNEIPFVETQREQPVSAYSAAKTAIVHFAQMLHRARGFPVVIVRPSIVYGPMQGGEMLIPSLIRSSILGNGFNTTPGEQTRDFIYIDDVIDGLIRAVAAQEAIGEIMNLGSGVERRIKDVIELVIKLSGSSIDVNIGARPYRDGEIMRHQCSIEKAKRLLGWQPRVTLEEGLKETVAWYQKHREEIIGGKFDVR